MTGRLISVTFRNLRKNLLYTIIVVGGLSLGMTTFLAILQWSAWHSSFDRHLPDAKSLYRISLIEQRENFERHTARILHGDIVEQFHNDNSIPEIISIVRLAPFRNAIVRHGDIIYYEDKSFACDPEFISFFKPEIIIGDPETMLNAPFKAVLTEELASKYFKNENPIGKTIRIAHQFSFDFDDYEITGIIQKFPGNTHFDFQLLTSFEDPSTYNGTAWVYVKVKDGTGVAKLEKLIKDFIDENNDENYTEGVSPIVTPLLDIHLHSHLARELEKNVYFLAVVILFIAGLLVFILAWFNFTLLTISQNQLNLKKLIYQWQLGAGRKIFFKQFFIEFFTIGFISLLLASFLGFLLNTAIKNTIGISLIENQKLLLISTSLFILILIISSAITALYATTRLYGILKRRYFSASMHRPLSMTSRNWFIRIVISLEFIITYVLLSNLVMMKNQVDHAINLQIGAMDKTTIQIPSLPRPVIDDYKIFREEIRKYPVFEDITAMMEEPGGMAMDAFTFQIEGIPESKDRLFVFPVDENFIRFYDLELLSGVDFPEYYDTEDTTEYFILNETAAKLFELNNYDELTGRILSMNFGTPGFIYPGKIIGIIKDFHLSNSQQEVTPMVVFPEHTWLYCFSLRIQGDRQEAIKTLRKVWKDLFPDYPLRYYFTSEIYETLYETELTEVRVMIIFSILSLLIAGTGLFALSGFFIQGKMHAAAIRKINGARIRNILYPELKQYLLLALVSSVIAFPISWMLIHNWLNNFAYKTELTYWIYPSIAVFLILFSWASVFYHAYRLARLNPTKFIRSE